MEMPGLKTRTKNKKIHPAVNAGVEKKSRRTKAEMVQVREDEATAKAHAALEQRKAEKRLAMLEDQQRRTDITYAATANHPVDKPLKARVPDVNPSDSKAHSSGADSGSGEDSDEYAQAEDEESEESEEDDADDASDEDEPKKKKKKGTTRAKIVAAHTTQDSTGTPAVEDAAKAPKRKAPDNTKAAASKKSKKNDLKKKSGLDDRRSKSQAKGASSAPEDDSMVTPGGPALDDDEKEHVEKPTKGKKKGKPSAAPILIRPVPSKALTRKAVRGGNAKWTLRDLPAGTAAEFSNEVVPLACEQAGVIAPWDGLTQKQIQRIVDRVYGEGVHKVTEDGVWAGLIEYRLYDWRGGFGTQAVNGVEMYFNADNEDEPEGGGEDEEMPDAIADPLPSAPPAAETVPVAAVAASPSASVGPSVRKFSFKTPTGIAEFVEWALAPHEESGTMAFHWKQWGDGKDKKGFLQTDLIVYTFAYHLSRLDAIPGGYERLTEPPVGALLIAVQAVQRALQFWRTGVYVNPHPMPRSNYFSGDVWGDYSISGKGGKDKLVRRATKFMPAVQKWDEDRWNKLKEVAQEWVQVRTRRRATSSRSASEVGDDSVVSEDEEVIVVSD
ncbi:hypothetical protein MVEN_01390600 [Mycena venus]|uniref:Uncharacterized protein n=1 Tax=Mycena venus TaxID=2733690 RepID=A0A8H7CUI2_9AGAR|nr:hypothetical protein MVEN_01390600 [Mycena venus]